MDSFSTSTSFYSSGRGSFLVLSAAGHARGPRVQRAQVWDPAELRGACSGDSKSRKLATNHGIRFRPPRASRRCYAKDVRLFYHPHEL